jgi:hypothetical protein
LVLKLGGLEEEGSGEASGVTGVGSRDTLMCFGMRFCNLGKVGQRLVGCPTMLHNAHGGGMHGGEVGERFLILSCASLVCGGSPFARISVSCGGNISPNCVTDWVSGWVSH